MKKLITAIFILSFLLYADESCDNNLKVQPYGFFKLDMSYDSDLSSTGNFARWALPNSDDAIPTTNITAKQSRFGMNIAKGDISGKVEIDFYGVGSAENKGGVLLRKAYAEAKFEKFTLRAGQDSDIISPLVPSTINYPVAWWAGNIGYRRPMVKVFGTCNLLSWNFGLVRNIGGDINADPDGDGVGDGKDDGAFGILPEVQGRIGITLRENYTIGLSGHYAQRDTLGTDGKYSTWSGNLDLNIIINPKFTFSGEVFIGSNLADKLGGIGIISTVDGVDTQGGWINLKFKPNKDLSLSAGFSMDDPCDCDLEDGMRSKNTMVFANFYKNLLQGFLLGVEVSNWTTEYKNMDTASALRGQIAFLYKF